MRHVRTLIRRVDGLAIRSRAACLGRFPPVLPELHVRASC
jgi:hypothetical protein